MTIIVGMIAQGDTIVVACDSQTTTLNSKQHDLGKISLIEAGLPFVIAQSGNADLATRAVEMFEERIKTAPITDRRSAASVLEQCIADLRRQIGNQYAMSAESLYQFCQQNVFELLLSHFYNGEAQMFTADFALGICNRKKTYTLLGCGSSVAQFIINGFDTKKLTREGSAILAIYMVNEAKKVDIYCGGPTWFAWITKEGATLSCQSSDKGLANTIKAIEEHDTGVKSEWIENAAKNLRTPK